VRDVEASKDLNEREKECWLLRIVIEEETNHNLPNAVWGLVLTRLAGAGIYNKLSGKTEHIPGGRGKAYQLFLPGWWWVLR